MHSARVLARARVLLLLDRSQRDKRTLREVAEAARVSLGTVSNIKKRYLAGGLERALHDLPRPGGVRKIDGKVEARLSVPCATSPKSCVS